MNGRFDRSLHRMKVMGNDSKAGTLCGLAISTFSKP
jgi:hypothetical protein